jgi:hypothetical protein
MHSNPDNDEVVHGRCVTSIPKESNHLGSPRCLATRGQEDHGGQHGPFPREYRPGLFILTKLAAHLLSHLAFYLLMIGMPLIGWGMLSAAGYPIVLFGSWHLPAILPHSDSLHALLWDAHFYLAFSFFALILLHVAAALFHALVRRDGVFDTMTTGPTYSKMPPTN